MRYPETRAYILITFKCSNGLPVTFMSQVITNTIRDMPYKGRKYVEHVYW